MSLRIRRGTNAQRATTPLDLGELVYTTDTKQLYIGNGIDAGGDPIIRLGTGLAWADVQCTTIIATGAALQVSADATPSLGGNLTLNSHDITGTGNINITGNVASTSIVSNTYSPTVGSSSQNKIQLGFGGVNPNTAELYSVTGGGLTTFSQFSIFGTRGTISSPTDTLAADILGGYGIRGYYGGSYKTAVNILGLWSSTAILSDSRPKSNLNLVVGGGGSSIKLTTFQYDGGLVLPGYVKVGSYTPASYPAGGPPSVIAGLVIGAAGTFTCTSTTLSVGGIVSIKGTNTGSGIVSNGDYYIIATNGTTTFTLSATRTGTAISTTAGTAVGLTVNLSLLQKGTIIFDSSDNHFYGFNGTSWVAFTGP
jgi:hypothetical protein